MTMVDMSRVEIKQESYLVLKMYDLVYTFKKKFRPKDRNRLL